MMFAQAAPSSACRHLLPVGEKGGRVCHIASPLRHPDSRVQRWTRGLAATPLLPSGRRCRQADEGAARMTKNQDIRERHTP
jgi:hypothetical protein